MLKRNPTLTNPQGAPSPKKNRPDSTCKLSYEDYRVGWLCAITTEFIAACAFFDERHATPDLEFGNDHNAYAFGSMGGHNVVVAVLSEGQYGIAPAAVVAANMHRSFPNIQVSLMVGIGGGAPSAKHDIRLGDVVVSIPKNGNPGVFQYDFGKTMQNQVFQQTGLLSEPPELLRGAVTLLRAEYETEGHTIEDVITAAIQENPKLKDTFKRPPSKSDVLYKADVVHRESNANCDKVCGQDQSQFVTRFDRPDCESLRVHYGIIASANQVMKDASVRDKLSQQRDVLCFEMEAAGLRSSTNPHLVIRGICDYSDSHKNKQWQGYASMTAAAYAKDLLRHIRKQDTIRRNTMELPLLTERAGSNFPQQENIRTEQFDDNQRQELLDSLRFDQIDSRRLTIKKAHSKTCKWLLKHDQYIDWLDEHKFSEHHGFMWIRGKPGAGKSTLMKFILEKLKRTMKDSIVISFFFNARGSDLEKSTIGMYRSLLLQLLEKVPSLQSVLDSVESYRGTSPQWGIELLKDLFEQAVISLGKNSLVCLIDALDEAEEGQIRDMISFFEQLGDQAVSSGVWFRSCFASRHYPQISLKKGISMILERQEGHSSDITSYLTSELRIGSSEKDELIRAKMKDKASGVFLWVYLVVDILNTAHDNGYTSRQLEKKLDDTPGDLSTLFRDILMRDDANKEKMLLCIQWVLFARNPLSPVELYFAVLSGAGSEALRDTDPIEVTQLVTQRFMINSSKGLVEITKSNKPTVQFIHESVRDFFLEDNGFKEIWPELEDKFAGRSHDRLKECCLIYMTSVDVRKELNKTTFLSNNHLWWLSPKEHESTRKSVEQGFPFLQHAVCNVLYYSDVAQGEEISQLNFLKNLDVSNWTFLGNLFEKHQVRRHKKTTSLLYILAEQNLANLVSCHPDKTSGFRKEDERYGAPMIAASATGSRDAGQALLQALAEHQSSTSILYSLHEKYNDKSYKINVSRNFNFPQRKGIFSVLMDQGDYISVIYYLLSSENIIPIKEDVLKQLSLSHACYQNDEQLIGLILIVKANSSKEELIRALTSYTTERYDERGYNLTEELMERHCILSRKDIRELSAWAHVRGHTAMIQMLIVNSFHSRFTHAYYEGIREAIDDGAQVAIQNMTMLGTLDCNLKDQEGRTPLSSAAELGIEPIVEFLLNTGTVDFDSRDKRGQTPLSWAAKKGREPIVKLLLQTEMVDPDSKDDYGRTPLCWAAQLGRESIVELLLQMEAVYPDSRDKDGRTPLSYAAEMKNEPIVKLLLDTGRVDPDSRDNNGQTPLSWAVEGGREPIVKLLLDTGGVDPDTRDNNGRTSLSRAAGRGEESIVELLLQMETVHPDSRDKDGRTPLSWAAEMGRDPVVELLLNSEKVDPNLGDEKGWTPLSWAAQRENTIIVELLLKMGTVDPDPKDYDGRTPLSRAVQWGSESLVKLLLDTGRVDINLMDRHGKTPLSRAAESGRTAITTLFREMES